MADVARIPRSRGSACGLLLILLGAWGGLVPFVGPYFHFAYTPDKAWVYTTGRLYLSVVPGAAAVIGGLFVLITRSRAVGVLGGFLGALGGAWFITGFGVVTVVLKKTTITPGVPTGPATAALGHLTIRQFGEELGFFTGLGMLIIFVGAIAIGRFSMIAAKDVSADGADDYEPYQGQAPLPGGQDQFPATTGPLPPPQPQPATTGQFPAVPERYPATSDQYPTTSGQYPTAQEQYSATTGPFPSATGRFPTASGQFPPAEEQEFRRPAPPPSSAPPPSAPPSDQSPTSTS
jgi:hypothetical protein